MSTASSVYTLSAGEVSTLYEESVGVEQSTLFAAVQSIPAELLTPEQQKLLDNLENFPPELQNFFLTSLFVQFAESGSSGTTITLGDLTLNAEDANNYLASSLAGIQNGQSTELLDSITAFLTSGANADAEDGQKVVLLGQLFAALPPEVLSNAGLDPQIINDIKYALELISTPGDVPDNLSVDEETVEETVEQLSESADAGVRAQGMVQLTDALNMIFTGKPSSDTEGLTLDEEGNFSVTGLLEKTSWMAKTYEFIMTEGLDEDGSLTPEGQAALDSLGVPLNQAYVMLFGSPIQNPNLAIDPVTQEKINSYLEEAEADVEGRRGVEIDLENLGDIKDLTDFDYIIEAVSVALLNALEDGASPEILAQFTALKKEIETMKQILMQA